MRVKKKRLDKFKQHTTNILKPYVEKAFNNNQLDKLIPDSYKTYGRSGYYKEFCDKKLQLERHILNINVEIEV